MIAFLARTTDATFLNGVANHPDVRPWLGPGSSAVDMAPEVEDPRNYTLQSPHGGIAFLDRGNGTFEAHFHFLPECWGEEPRRAFSEAIGYMFAETDCDEIVVQVPSHNERSRRFLARQGFRYRQTGPNLWEGAPIPVYGLTCDQWCELGDASCPG